VQGEVLAAFDQSRIHNRVHTHAKTHCNDSCSSSNSSQQQFHPFPSPHSSRWPHFILRGRTVLGWWVEAVFPSPPEPSPLCPRHSTSAPLSLSVPTDANNTQSTATLAEARPFLSNVARGLPDGFDLSLASNLGNTKPPAVNYTLATIGGVQTVRLDNSGVDKVGFTPVGASYDKQEIGTLSMVFRCASCAPMALNVSLQLSTRLSQAPPCARLQACPWFCNVYMCASWLCLSVEFVYRNSQSIGILWQHVSGGLSRSWVKQRCLLPFWVQSCLSFLKGWKGWSWGHGCLQLSDPSLTQIQSPMFPLERTPINWRWF